MLSIPWQPCRSQSANCINLQSHLAQGATQVGMKIPPKHTFLRVLSTYHSQDFFLEIILVLM